MNTSSTRAWHAPNPKSKRSIRRKVREERESFSVAKTDHALGVRVDDFRFLRGLCMRAAYGARDGNGAPLHEAFIEDRALAAFDRTAPLSADRWPLWDRVRADVLDIAPLVPALQGARLDVRHLRRLRAIMRGEDGRKVRKPAARERYDEQRLVDHIRVAYAGLGHRPPSDVTSDPWARVEWIGAAPPVLD